MGKIKNEYRFSITKLNIVSISQVDSGADRWAEHCPGSRLSLGNCASEHARGCGGPQPAGRHTRHIHWSGMFIVMYMLVSMRGGVGVLNQLAVTLGIFIGQVCLLVCQ
jgi:hypothetical protein